VSPAAKPRRLFADLWNLVWQPAAFSIPFALFFLLLSGGQLRNFVGFYLVSAVFAYTITICIRVLDRIVLPRFGPPEDDARGSRIVVVILWYLGACQLGTILASVIVNATLVPGFLGGPRKVLILAVYGLLFSALWIGIAFAFHFYREALKKVRAEQELSLARRIQRSFLLTRFPSTPRLEVHAINLSSREVSGDFYDVVAAGDGSYLLAIADVAGKGVGAALLTQMLQASLRTQAGATASVAGILRNVNRLVYRSTAVQQFATFFLARVEDASLRLSFCNAGHNYPVLFRRDGRRELLSRGGVVVGILEDAAYEEETLTLEPGDRLLLYTDGVSEAANARGEMFGEQRLMDLVASLPSDLDATRITDRVVEAVRAFLDGVEAGDDITVMALRVREPAAVGPAVPRRP
jgi:serine phosphatase RsbU (regulator of sigma subunit)